MTPAQPLSPRPDDGLRAEIEALPALINGIPPESNYRRAFESHELVSRAAVLEIVDLLAATPPAAVLGDVPEDPLLDAANTALRQWHGISNSMRQKDGTHPPLETANDEEAMLYRETRATVRAAIRDDFRAALPAGSGAGELDAAWREAADLLASGWWLEVKGAFVGGRYVVTAYTALLGGPPSEDDTPAAALRALTARLRERAATGSGE